MSTPNNKENKQYPTQVELPDGTVIKVAEIPGLKKFFDEIVTITADREKTKLYANMEGQTTEVATLKEQLSKLNTEMQTIMGSYQTSIAEQEGLRKQISQANAGTVLNEESIRRMMEAMFAEQIPKLFQANIEPIRQTTEQLQKQRIEDYRAARLVELAVNDEVIPEMVSGNTKEEIDASIVQAKAIRSRYPAAAASGTTVQTPVPGAAAVTNAAPAVVVPEVSASATAVTAPKKVVVPQVPSLITPESSDMPDIKGMTNDEFKAQRETLLAKLQAYDQQVRES